MSLYFMLHVACFLFMAIFSCKLSSILLDFTTHLGSTNICQGILLSGHNNNGSVIL